MALSYYNSLYIVRLQRISLSLLEGDVNFFKKSLETWTTCKIQIKRPTVLKNKGHKSPIFFIIDFLACQRMFLFILDN